MNHRKATHYEQVVGTGRRSLRLPRPRLPWRRQVDVVVQRAVI